MTEHTSGALEFPASYIQAEWFHAAGGGPSNDNIMYVLEVSGPLDPAAIRQALQLLTTRHEALRTGLIRVDADIRQKVRRDVATPFDLLDMSGKPTDDPNLVQTLDNFRQYPFAITDPPLWRALLIRLDQSKHLLVLVLNHVIADAWTGGVLQRDIAALYEDVALNQPSTLPHLTHQLSDFAAWILDQHDTAREQHWRDQLSPLPTFPRLPTTEQWHPGQPFTLAARAFPTLPAADGHRLRDAANSHGHTLGTAIRAAIVATVAPFVDDDLILGVLYDARDRRELLGIVGPLIDHLPVRVHIPPKATLLDLMREIDSAWTTANEHLLPLGRILASLHPGAVAPERPLFDIEANYIPHLPSFAATATTPKGAVTFSFHEGPRFTTQDITAHHEMSLAVRLAHLVEANKDGGLDGWIVANADALGYQRIPVIAQRFTTALTVLAHSPSLPVRDIVSKQLDLEPDSTVA